MVSWLVLLLRDLRFYNFSHWARFMVMISVVYRNLVGWETYHDYWALVGYDDGSDAEATHNITLGGIR